MNFLIHYNKMLLRKELNSLNLLLPGLNHIKWGSWRICRESSFRWL